MFSRFTVPSISEFGVLQALSQSASFVDSSILSQEADCEFVLHLWCAN
jgi:hypothetical protein